MQRNIDKNRKNRGVLARHYLQTVFKNPKHPMYTASDTDFARDLNVTRLTVINIRKKLHMENRHNRIIDLLKQIDTTEYTLRELAALLDLKYQNLYKLVRMLKLQTRPDKKPIESMIEFQKKSKQTFRS
ncbi:MAG: hypothetical protein GX639_01600 [Fibrobacter sp.]|nr:hypothetical protein [Fibrobacter sp.]